MSPLLKSLLILMFFIHAHPPYELPPPGLIIPQDFDTFHLSSTVHNV